jgi:hypothetical protein
MDTTKRGFACGSNAVDAARKNHELGTAHRFDSLEAATAGRRGLVRRWQDRSSGEGSTSSSALTAPGAPATSDAR